MSEDALPPARTTGQTLPFRPRRRITVDPSRSWRDETQDEGGKQAGSSEGGSGGDGGDTDLLKFRVGKLEEAAKEILSELRALRNDINDVKVGLAKTASSQELAEVKGRLSSLASAAELGEVKGAVSKLPTNTTIVVLVLGLVGLTGFARWAYDYTLDRRQQAPLPAAAAPPVATPQPAAPPAAPPSTRAP